MKRFYYFVWLVWVPCCLQGQSNYGETLSQLEARLSQGDVQALRDVGTLLDEDTLVFWQSEGESQRNRLGTFAAHLLRRYLLLEDEAILKDESLKRKTFLNFYYRQANQLKFSEWLHQFVLPDLNQKPKAYRLGQKIAVNFSPNRLLGQYRQNLRNALRDESYTLAATHIEEIAALQTKESFEFIQACANGQHWKYGDNPYEVYTFEKIIFSLRHYTHPASLFKIYSILQQIPLDSANRIDPQLVAVTLQMITNHPIPNIEGKNALAIAEHYVNLSNQYKDWEKLRQAGYQKIFDYSDAYFKDKIDYWGKMLNNSQNYYWIKKHAVDDLMQFRTPKLLLYLAAQIYQNQPKQAFFWYEDLQILAKIRALIPAEIWVKDDLGNWVTNPAKDQTSALNYVLYWLQHYQDYQWDEDLQLFINPQATIPAPDDYDGLLKDIFSPNPNQAFQALERLSLAKAEEVLARIPSHYESLIRIGRNDLLPPFPFKALQQVLKLRQFCESQNIAFPFPEAFNGKFNRLKAKLSTSKRYTLENELIQSLDLAHCTSLEIFGILHQHQEKWYFHQSLSRILNRVYAKHWEELLGDENQLRLYLKKSRLFTQLGGSGFCQTYLNKFENLHPDSQARLETLWEKEKDPDILYPLALLLPRSLLNLDQKLKAFLKNPQYARIDIQTLQVKAPEDFQAIIERIRSSPNPKARQKLFELLSLWPDLLQVPFLMSLLNDQRVTEQRFIGGRILNFTVADYAVFQLERLFKHSFSDEKDFYDCRDRRQFLFRRTHKHWQNLWKKDQDHYPHWEKTFFEQRLIQLTNSSSIPVNLLNNLLNSPYYEEKDHQSLISQSLAKVFPQSDLKFLDFQKPIQGVDLQDYQAYMDHVGVFIHILKNLEIKPEESEDLLILLKTKSQDLDDYLQGKIFRELLPQSNLIYWLEAFPDKDFLEQMNKALESQYQGYVTTSWEDDQIRNWQFLLNNLHKSVAERIQVARELAEEGQQMDALDIILTRSHYKGFGDIVKNYRLFRLPSYPLRIQYDVQTYIREDLGLFNFEIASEGANQVLNQYQSLSPFDFYRTYCKGAGIDIFQADGKLDFKKIYEVLRYDQVAEFASLAPLTRSDQVYPVIRLLELHFETRLGFPKNLQHGDSMITKLDFSKRVQKWMDFIYEKQFVYPSKPASE